MSAFMVDLAHIRQLVKLAIEGPAERGPRYPGDAWYGPRWEGPTPDGPTTHEARHYHADAMVLMLTMENLASIHARYPDTIDEPEHTPGPLEHYWEGPLTYERPRSHANAIEGLSILACYEYQSCEHEGWATSEAKSFCDGLRHALIRALPGYDNAAWEWDAA